jgi:hypothetical protein
VPEIQDPVVDDGVREVLLQQGSYDGRVLFQGNLVLGE